MSNIKDAVIAKLNNRRSYKANLKDTIECAELPDHEDEKKKVLIRLNMDIREIDNIKDFISYQTDDFLIDFLLNR